MFDRRSEAPKQFSELIGDEISKKWMPRKTQIVPIEIITPILALKTFRDHLRNRDVLLLIDSEAVDSRAQGFGFWARSNELQEKFHP